MKLDLETFRTEMSATFKAHLAELEPDRTVSAANLRAMGFDPGADIPDVATIPLSSLSLSTTEAEPHPDPSKLRIGLVLHISEPFQWFQIDLEIPAKADE